MTKLVKREEQYQVKVMSHTPGAGKMTHEWRIVYRGNTIASGWYRGASDRQGKLELLKALARLLEVDEDNS